MRKQRCHRRKRALRTVGGLWADYGRTVGGLWSSRRAPTLFVDMLALPCVPLDLSATPRAPLRRIDAGDVEFSLLRTLRQL
jgi:hypothetical protein